MTAAKLTAYLQAQHNAVRLKLMLHTVLLTAHMCSDIPVCICVCLCVCQQALAQEVANYLGMDLGKVKIKSFADGEIYVQVGESIRGCDVFLIQPTSPPVNDHLMELLIMIDACKRASARSITAVIPYFGYARADRKTQGREAIAAKLTANLITEAGADRWVGCVLGSATQPARHTNPYIPMKRIQLTSRQHRQNSDGGRSIFCFSWQRPMQCLTRCACAGPCLCPHRVLAIDLHSGQCVGYFDIPVDHVYGDSVILDYLASKRIPTGELVVVSPDVGGVAR